MIQDYSTVFKTRPTIRVFKCTRLARLDLARTRPGTSVIKTTRIFKTYFQTWIFRLHNF